MNTPKVLRGIFNSMMDNLWNTASSLYTSGKYLVHKALNYVKEPIMIVPKTTQKIIDSPNIQFILSNSILINGVEFILPFVGYQATKNAIVYVLNAAYPDDEDNEKIKFIAYTIDCTIYPILFLRLKISNTLFNSVATVGAAMKLNDEFADRVQIFPTCRKCTPNFDRFTKQISLELHYLCGTAVLGIINPCINQLPYVATPISVLFNAYWLGIMLFQYPLTRNKVCAEHQVALLMQNRSHVLIHGLFLFITLSIALSITTFMTQEIISSSITTTAVTNLLIPLFLIYIHHVDLPFVELSPKNINTTFDPVFMLWKLSLYLTQESYRLGHEVIQKNQGNPLVLLDTIKSTSHLLKKSPFVPKIAHIGTAIFIPAELKTLKAFSCSDRMRPYLILFLNNAEELLRKANAVNRNTLTQLTYIALKRPALQSVLLACSTLIANTQAGIPHDFTLVLIKTLLALNINEALPALHETIKNIHEASKKSQQRQQKKGMRFFDIGRQTPPSWFQEEGFVILPASTETTHSNPDDWEEIDDEPANPQSWPQLFNPEPEPLDKHADNDDGDEYDHCSIGAH